MSYFIIPHIITLFKLGDSSGSEAVVEVYEMIPIQHVTGPQYENIVTDPITSQCPAYAVLSQDNWY